MRARSGSGQRSAARRAVLGALAALLGVTVGCDDLARRAVGGAELGAEELAARLAAGERPLVIDLRDFPRYAAGHIANAVALREEQLAGYLTRRGPPREWSIVTVCDHGRRSLLAAATVRGLGYRAVSSLRGGMVRWGALGLPQSHTAATPADPQLLRPPREPTSLLTQVVMVLAAFVIKPAYMVLALLLILWLRRARARDLVLIRRGLLLFLLGEGVCAANFFLGETDALDLVHGVGMLLMGALVSWGLWRMLDERVLRLADPAARCAVQRLCGSCWKREPVSCGVQRLFLLLAPALALLALLPLSGEVHRVDVLLPCFGDEVRWSKGVEAQLVEFRLYPLLAAALLLWTTARLLVGRVAAMERAQLPFFAGCGVLSYSLLRFMLFTGFSRLPVWGDFWEEVTELIAVGAVGLILWVFRRPLGLRRTDAAAPPPAVDAPPTPAAAAPAPASAPETPAGEDGGR